MSRRLALFLGLLIMLVGTVVPAFAQSADTEAIRIRQAELSPEGDVRLVVSTSGEAAAGEITADQIQVTESGSTIADFEVHPLSESIQRIAVVLVMGHTSDEPIRNAKAAAQAFVDQLPPYVDIALVTFNQTALVRADFGTDRQVIEETIAGLEGEGGTALYDGLARAASALERLPDHQRNIVVLSDGRDSISQTTLKTALADIKAVEAPVLSVGLANGDFDGEVLEAMARQTEGTSVLVGDADQIVTAFQDVAEGLTSQYEIIYTGEITDARELDIMVSVQTSSALLTDEIVVSNPRVPAPRVDDRPEVLPPAAVPMLGPIGLILGALMFFGAGAIMVSRFMKPRKSAAMRLLSDPHIALQKQVSTADEGSFTSRLAARAVDLVEHMPKPEGFEERLQLLLDRADWPVRASEFLVLQALGSFGGVMLGMGLMGSFWMGVLLAAVGVIGPKAILKHRVEKRQKAFMNQLPDVLQLLAGSLRAGHSLLQGLDTVTREAGAPASNEFARVIGQTRLGMPLEQALDGVVQRVGTDDFRWVLIAINIQRQVGGNLSALLETMAATLRDRDQLRRQVQVLSAEGRVSAWILSLMPFALAGYLAVVNGEYIGALFGSSIGRVMVMGALMFMVAGIFWMRKIVRIEA
jgi:tight adherence protein B